ncbi:hypothetical protein HX096_05235 [Empedobacter falsenii]|nr:hypothetical protein [Empedobacter falsenii]MDM1547261.1 hypothetical protein [Empedobacter falsenii]
MDIYYRLNFCLFLIFNLYVFELKQKKLLIFNLLFLFFLNTPSPDLPVFVLSILSINEYLRYNNKASDYLFYATILFVIKPISIVLLLFFGIEYLRNKEYKNLKDKNLLLIIFVVFLFIFKGIIISANPLFPIGFTSINSLKWASPQQLYELSAQKGKFIPLKDSFIFEEVARMNTTEYFQAIFFQPSSRTIIFLLIICLTIYNLLIGFYKKNYFIKSLIFCCIVKLLIILIFSNQFRFLLDVLIIDLLIMFKLVNTKIFNKYSELLSLIFVYITSFILIFSIFKGDYFKNIKSFSYMRSINFDQILIPGNYKETELNINNLKISKTKLEKFLQYQIYLQQIDSTDVRKGFYFEKIDRKREKILDILKEEQKKQVK